MSKVIILETGGTISGHSQNKNDLKDYKTGYPFNNLLNEIPEIHNIAEVTTEQLFDCPSTELTPNHWIMLKRKTEYYLNEKSFDGVVISHGTNTLEETAYFLHLTVNSEKPIVLVGAQRPLTAIGSDAISNLLNALRVAIHPGSSNKGVLVVLNDEINCAREVTKTNTYRLETFQSGQMGFLGYVDVDGTVQFYRSPTRKHTIQSCFSSITIKNLPRVAIVYSYAGSDGEVIRLITQSKMYDGIVIAGTGAGLFSEKEKEALLEANKVGISIVRSSRVGNGRVVDLECYKDFNFISSDNLLPQKARILLMLSLLRWKDANDLQRAFCIY